LYRLTGWNDWTPDINGEVGHPLGIRGPNARCVPGGNWSSLGTIASGTLPPGLTMDPRSFDMGGIPRERGHWIVKVKLDNIVCNGSSYKGFDQELRFHITGSGKVVN
jgi:hypothetical protein